MACQKLACKEKKKDCRGMWYLELSSGTDTGDRETDVDGGTDTSEEQFGFQENLA
jgi:hypothetical protein